ncbi:MAG: hypothetical protein U0T81_09360 [Saprospiraceae bacterium]
MVIIVGVSRYDHMPSLKYSDDDAYKIYAFLKSEGHYRTIRFVC